MDRNDLEIGMLIQVDDDDIKRGTILSSYKGIWKVIKLTYFQVFVKNVETGIIETISNHMLYLYWHVVKQEKSCHEGSKEYNNKIT